MRSNSLIQFHPLLLLFLLASYFLGMFVELICFFVIITIHELGHYLAAKYYKWNITRLLIWPFGGVMETEDYYNRSSKEELIVTIAGPAQHIWIYALLGLLNFINVQHVFLDQLFMINTIILLFNLIPILPLDGGRLVFIFLTRIIAFHQSIIWMALYSIAFIGIANVLMYVMNWTSIHLTFLSLFLLLDNWMLWQNKHILLLKHLLARYFITNVDRSNVKFLKASSRTPLSELVKHFKKDCYHYVYLDQRTNPISEDDCLQALFTRNEPALTVERVQANEA